MTRQIARIFVLLVLGAGTVLAQHGPEPVAKIRGEEAPLTVAPTSLNLMVGRSQILDIGRPIARVSLTSSDIADALVTSSSQLLLNGKTPGTISMFVWDREGGVSRYEVAVERDLARLSAQLRQLFPGEEVNVHSTGRQIVLAGNVSSKEAIEKIVNVSAGYVEKRDEIVPLLQVRPGPRTDQVLLRVRFAEVDRSTLTELGISLFTSPLGIGNTIGRVQTGEAPGPIFSGLDYSKSSGKFGSRVLGAEGKFTFGDLLNVFLFSEKYDLGVVIKALQTRGLYQSLAEPNLVSESGKEASFLAGGEFPIPVSQGSATSTAITVTFKEFGIRLSFLPIVDGDRVHLKVKPEVSTLDFANAVTLNGFRIPALTTRRTETELELQNGQTFAIAGLMNNNMNQTLQKIPGIGDIPILGKLFRSKAAAKNQTELVVIITPEILPTGSVGVTSQLPPYTEPFIPPVPTSKLMPPPPPAFQQPPRAPGAADAEPGTPVAVKP